MRSQILPVLILVQLWAIQSAPAQETSAAPAPGTVAPPTPAPVETSPVAALAAEAAAPAPRDTTWKKELVGGLNLASSYYDNWSQGGDDNIAWGASLKGRLEHDDSDWNWTTTGLAKYGQVKLGDQALRKTDDDLEAQTVLSRKLTSYVAPYVSASFQTQFARGYQYPSETVPPISVSNFLDPLYMIQSAGVGTMPLDWLRTRAGAAVHETRTDEYRTWANGPNSAGRKAWDVQPGVEWVTDLKKTVADKLLLESALATFSNLKGWDAAVLDWTSTVSYQFSKYINVNASGELHRDIQQSHGWQWKHQLALGLNYSFL
jgi:hypothetical protein